MDYITIDAQRMDYIRRGREEGRLETLYEFVRDQMLSVSEAAKKADQTEEEFKAGMDIWLAEHEPAQE